MVSERADSARVVVVLRFLFSQSQNRNEEKKAVQKFSTDLHVDFCIYKPLSFAVHYSGNKWTLNTLSGKCFTCAPHRKLFGKMSVESDRTIRAWSIETVIPSFFLSFFLFKFSAKLACGKFLIELLCFACSYQHTKFHKQTKNQWARDDPAFVVISSLLLAVAALAYCAAYDHSAGHAVFVVISVLLFHFLITGAGLATCCWFLTNAYLREEAPNSHVVEQRVEWQICPFLSLMLYAFDVHCNSFFPMFVMLYVIHYFLSPLLVAHGFIPVLLSNLLFMVAASYYHYLNFLGYYGTDNMSLNYCSITLPGENNIFPLSNRSCHCPISYFSFNIAVILSGFNPSRYLMNVYFSQRV
ncbi:hypothetical protein POTOM_002327 [Populus tomentosa]|uniref:UNC-50 family protein n=1 Tax=Populus tomentosa TaxID=118781 RepID=A0A8X8DJJ4_POPTO|nr:hypothetical protein POTOM_002327 [Populus tomentosa]